MEEALARVKELAAQDEDSRRKAVAALPKLASSLENVQETINRYGHLVRRLYPRMPLHIANYFQHLQSAMVQTGVEMGLFKHLSDSPEGLTVDQISDKTGAELQLIGTLPCPMIFQERIQVLKFENSTISQVSRCHRRSGRGRERPIRRQPCYPKSQRGVS